MASTSSSPMKGWSMDLIIMSPHNTHSLATMSSSSSLSCSERAIMTDASSLPCNAASPGKITPFKLPAAAVMNLLAAELNPEDFCRECLELSSLESCSCKSRRRRIWRVLRYLVIYIGKKKECISIRFVGSNFYIFALIDWLQPTLSTKQSAWKECWHGNT